MKTIFIERLKYDNNQWKWVPEVVCFDTEKDFDINEENLEFEICRMGKLLVKYGEASAELHANLKRKEEHAKFIQTCVSSAIRSDWESKGVRFTEGKLSEEVTKNQDYQDALASLHLLRADAVKVDHWYRSAIKKADLLNALAYRQNAELRRGYGA